MSEPTDGKIVCHACGAWMPPGAPTCRFCGAMQAGSPGGAMQARSPGGEMQARPPGGGDGIPRRFAASVRICLRKYVVFAGRAPRAEYWWFVLFQALVGVTLSFVFALVGVPGNRAADLLVNLALFLPGVSVWVRRLHDVDRSGWWTWIVLVPLVGLIVLFVWGCSRGTLGDNRFGPRNGTLYPIRPGDPIRPGR